MLVRSQRESLHSGNTAPEVGPGSYALQEISNPSTRFASAPFGSTSNRLSYHDDEAPGPGAYDPRATNISSGNYSNHGGNARLSVASFASRTGRFRVSKNSYPGPGSYDAKLPENSKGSIVMHSPPQEQQRSASTGGGGGIAKNSMSNSQRGYNQRRATSELRHSTNTNTNDQQQQQQDPQRNINWVKVATAPSIPVGQQSFGYEEGPGGALVQQPAPYTGHDGTIRDVAGPGEYNPSYRVTKPTALTSSFGAQHSGQRSNPVQSDSLHKPGPGAYSPIQSQQPQLRLSTAKSCFNSRSERIVYPDSDQPGPGAYDITGGSSNNPRSSSFKDLKHYLAANPETFQAFGSSAADARQTVDRHVPGPGAYDINRPTVVVKNKSTKNAVFTSSVDRFSGVGGDGGTTITSGGAPPGPGSYEVATIGSLKDRLARIIPNRFGGFGSTSSRFTKPQQANESSPSSPSFEQYQQQQPQDSPYGPDANRKDKRSSAFRSHDTVNRKPQEQQGLTWTDVRVLPDMWQKRTFSSKPSMMSSAPRLMSSETDIPGPGTYATNADELKKGGTKFSRDRRLSGGGGGGSGGGSGAQYQNPAPGPGAYFAPSSWNKQSFNVTFT